jgi:hypothetical protein
MSSFEVEQSFRNIVRYYSKELVQINKGKKASIIFNDRQRKKLTKLGILERVVVPSGSKLKLTGKTLDLLVQTQI